MLYHLLVPLSEGVSALNVFRYITFRAGGALMTALFLSFWLGPKVIRWLKSKQPGGQPIRLDGPESHLLTKKGTPTMGGTLILLALSLSVLLWADLANMYVWLVLFVTLGYGLIGFGDDFLKLTKRNSKGLSARQKLLAQAAIGILVSIYVGWFADQPHGTGVAIPFFKELFVPLGLLFPIFGALVMMGSSNAVNLTDGLDGLAIVPVMIAAGCFGMIAYLGGNVIFANYLGIPHVPGAGEISVFLAALVGASMGFLWFNAPPAMVFMGDTGSLAAGALGATAVIVKHELVLMVIGGLFVLEAVSVIVQVASFKLTGRRVFRMAPLHHHFEKKGWQEPTIVIRFWIVASILALVGLSTLKLR